MRLHRLLFILLPVSVIASGAEQLESLVGASNPLPNACTRYGGPVMWGPVKQGGDLCVQGPMLVATSPVGSIVHASPGTGVGRVIVTGLDSNVAEELESFYSLAGGAISLKAIVEEITEGGFIVDEDSIQTSKIEHSDLKEVIFSVSAATPRLYSLPKMPELSRRRVWFPLAALGALASAFALVALRCRFRHGAEGNDLLVPGCSDSDLEPGEQ